MSDSPGNQPDSPQLDYARPVRFGWISRHRKLLIGLALLLAVAGPVWWNWQPLKHRALWLYWSHRAATHVMPEAAIVSITGPEAAQLPTTNPDYVSPAYTTTKWAQPSASYIPNTFRELSRLDGRLRSMAFPDGPVIFMGTMHRPDGTPRLVIITGGSEMDSRYLLRNTGSAVLPLPGWFDPLPVTGPPLSRGFRGSGPPPTPAAYRTGVRDPKDPSHAVIKYTLSESTTMVARGIAATRAGTGLPNATAAEISQVPRKVIGEGEIDVRLGNDDSLNFAIRGPGQLSSTSNQSDPQSLQTAAQQSQQEIAARRGRRSGPTNARGRG